MDRQRHGRMQRGHHPLRQFARLLSEVCGKKIDTPHIAENDFNTEKMKQNLRWSSDSLGRSLPKSARSPLAFSSSAAD